ncbi:hypothetical protein ACET3Z_014088 [Daucus carota]
MRPILMKGHERPLTYLKYNKEGDLLFSCALDRNPAVWSTVKSVELSVGDKLAVIATDSFGEMSSAIHVKEIAGEPSEQCGDSVIELAQLGGRSNRAVWGPLNRTIISGGEEGVVRVWDVETKKVIYESDKETGHQKAVTSLTKSRDGSCLLTGSIDQSAKLWDIRSMRLVRTYKAEAPVNAVTLSPLLDHVVLGGGQDASHVTNDPRAGKFEAKFYHKVLGEEFGSVKGHFGPINALAFNPDGKSFASGGEDGYVRLHHLQCREKDLMKGGA